MGQVAPGGVRQLLLLSGALEHLGAWGGSKGHLGQMACWSYVPLHPVLSSCPPVGSQPLLIPVVGRERVFLSRVSPLVCGLHTGTVYWLGVSGSVRGVSERGGQ